MLEFHQLEEWEGEPAGTWERYAVQYGALNGGRSHIPLLIFGIIPYNLSIRSGCAWVELLVERKEIPFAALRDARAAFEDFLYLTNWKLVCIVKKEGGRENNFVRFLGFEAFHETETETCYKGPNYGH